jgi:hypothetical protein
MVVAGEARMATVPVVAELSLAAAVDRFGFLAFGRKDLD